MQIAALNVRSEADAIAKRLTSKGYAAYVLSPATARRRSTGCASASSSRAAKPRRSRRSWKKKSSSSPGLRASPRVRRPPRAQFPEVRPSRLRLDRARAAARRAGCRDQPIDAPGVPARPDDRRRLLHRHALLDHPRDGRLRRPPAWVAVARQRRARRLPRAFPGAVRRRDRRRLVAFGARALVAAPLVWVATELGRTYVLTGFPWVLLGYSQATCCRSRSSRASFGVYGVSALVASVSAAAAHVRSVGPRRDADRAAAGGSSSRCADRWSSACGAAAASRDAELTRAGEPVRVGLIQGNVDQAEKWNPAPGRGHLPGLPAMTRQAIGHGAELVLWPESSTPFNFEEAAIAPTPTGARAGAAGARADPPRQRSDRARRRRPTLLQLRVSRSRRRHRPAASTARCTWCRSASTCRSSSCCSSRAAGRGGVGFLGRRGRRCCCRSAATWSARRSATKSSIPIWCGSSYAAAASC